MIRISKRSHPDRPPLYPWPVRGVMAGAVGTAALTLSYYFQRRRLADRPASPRTLRDGTPVRGMASDSGLDYDDTVVPGIIVASWLHLPVRAAEHPGEIAIALRWSYGSAFGIAHVWLRHRFDEPAATALFAGALLSVTFTMFPLLGGTPPPWSWPREVMLTSLRTHAIYAVASALTDDLLR
jgi:hypothetical protein